MDTLTMRWWRACLVVGVLALTAAGGCAPGPASHEAVDSQKPVTLIDASPEGEALPARPADATAPGGGAEAGTAEPAAVVLDEDEAPTPSSGASEGEARDEQAPAAAAPNPGDVSFPSGTYLFVEIVEERVVKTETGGRTTSFAGEQTSYDFDPGDQTLSGALKGDLGGDSLVVVGRLVVSQIDRNTAMAGRLYVLSGPDQDFAVVKIWSVVSDGTVALTLDGGSITLRPGESISVEVDTPAGDDALAVGKTQRTVTVTNHGFLPLAGLKVKPA